jgi:ABC-type uncharacterized transport system auxiliary subunit
MNTRIHIVAPAAAALLLGALGGCLSQPYRGQALFTLDGGVPQAPQADGKHAAGILRVRAVSIAQPYSGSEFAYRYSDGRMRTDPYAGYIASPQALITNATVERLAAEHLFDGVVGPDLGVVSAHELVISISTLCVVFEGAGATARVEGAAYLLDPTAEPTTMTNTFTMSATVPVNGDDATAVAQGLNSALSKWLGDLAGQIRAANLPPLAETLPKVPVK